MIQGRFAVGFLFMLLFQLCSPFTAWGKGPVRSFTGTVVKVIDGDTIKVNDAGTKIKIRLYGIDAPELETVNQKTGDVTKPAQSYGDEAYLALSDKIGGKTVRVDVMYIDRYKWVVSIVYLGERNINREMVAEGWAWAYRRHLDRLHESEFIKLEEEARAARRGLWVQDDPQPPWAFRWKPQQQDN